MSQPDASQLIRSLAAGDRHAAAELLPLLYAELRRLAESRLSKLPPGQTLQATALVHEAYMRLVRDADPGWEGRPHFFGAAAQAMRDIIVENARRKSRLKHGGDRARAQVSEQTIAAATLDLPSDEVLALDDALERLRAEQPRPAQVVMYRYFAGLSTEATAEVLGLSPRTVERDWRFAIAWMRDAMGAETAD